MTEYWKPSDWIDGNKPFSPKYDFDFAALSDKEEMTLIQILYELLPYGSRRDIVDDNIEDATNYGIQNEYETRGLGEDEVDVSEGTDDPVRMNDQARFSLLQELLHAYRHSRYVNVPMSVEEAVKTVRDMYSYNNIR